MSVIASKYQPGHAAMCGADVSDPSAQSDVTSNFVFEGVASVSQFNMHACIAYFDGSYYVMWSTYSTNDEDAAGQRVVISSSTDLSTWSAPVYVTPDPGSETYVARGLWVRDGELIAIVSLSDDSDLLIQGFTYSGSAWSKTYDIMSNYLVNTAPRLDPNGEWAWPCRDGSDQYLARGDLGDWTYESITNTSGVTVIEPSYLIGKGDVESILYRTNALGLAVAIKGESGWGDIRLTNYLDSQSEPQRVKVATGKYALVNNMNFYFGSSDRTKRNHPVVTACLI